MISSARNPKVAQAVRLKKHAFREEDGRFLAEGPQAVREALASEGLLEVLFAVDEVDPLVVQAGRSGAEVHLVSEDVMGKLTSTVTPQGLVGVVPERLARLLARKPGWRFRHDRDTRSMPIRASRAAKTIRELETIVRDLPDGPGTLRLAKQKTVDPFAELGWSHRE